MKRLPQANSSKVAKQDHLPYKESQNLINERPQTKVIPVNLASKKSLNNLRKFKYKSTAVFQTENRKPSNFCPTILLKYFFKNSHFTPSVNFWLAKLLVSTLTHPM